MADEKKKTDLSGLTNQEKRTIEDAFVILDKHIGIVSSIWSELKEKRKSKLLEHSPILNKFYELIERLR